MARIIDRPLDVYAELDKVLDGANTRINVNFGAGQEVSYDIERRPPWEEERTQLMLRALRAEADAKRWHHLWCRSRARNSRLRERLRERA